MITYQTEVDINGRLDHDGFPRFINSIIGEKGLSWDGKQSHQQCGPCTFDACADMDRMGILLSEQKETLLLKTFIAADITARKLTVRTELLTDAGLPFIQYQAPEFMPTLLSGGYLKNDADIPWTEKAIVIDGNNLELLSDVINNTGSSKAPTVFISNLRCGQPAVNVELLARKLAGLAHVMVLRDYTVAEKLREVCNRNEYNGAVGVYFPDGTRSTYLPADTTEYDTAMTNKVIMKTFLWTNTRTGRCPMTWQDVCSSGIARKMKEQHTKLEDTLARLREAEEAMERQENRHSEERSQMLSDAVAEAKAESEKILREFDEEMERLRTENEQLKTENRKLQYENRSFSDRLEKQGTPLVFAGKETDKFPGEMKDMVMCILKESLKSCQKGRRADIVKDLLEANGEGVKITENAVLIKNLFNNFARMDSSMKKVLEELGFSMVEDGKHIKMTYCNDSRYVEVLAKTPSDTRTGKNTAHEIINLVY